MAHNSIQGIFVFLSVLIEMGVLPFCLELRDGSDGNIDVRQLLLIWVVSLQGSI